MMRLVRIQRAEPEASLFAIPSTYVVKDDAGEFRISFMIRK
jgi:hypothetical protein